MIPEGVVGKMTENIIYLRFFSEGKKYFHVYFLSYGSRSVKPGAYSLGLMVNTTSKGF